MTEGDLGLDPKTILELPVETLALAVLQNYNSSRGWNRRNWLFAAERVLGPGRPHMNALAEAWAWLESRALVAPNPDQSAPDARIATRAGLRAIEQGSLDEIQAAERIGLDLHPRLQGKIRPVFLIGDYETAAFKAMKEVEVRVRDLGKFPADVIGVKLMHDAFKAGGPLADSALEAGERQARMELFAGAIGSFKNPTSHRTVTYSDPTEASEVILLADLLLRILDGIEANLK